MPAATFFCSHCGGRIDPSAHICACCGAETIDAGWVTLLKRVSPRRSTGRTREDDGKDDGIPF